MMIFWELKPSLVGRVDHDGGSRNEKTNRQTNKGSGENVKFE